MIPGEIVAASGHILINEGRAVLSLEVSNSGDRPIQVGSHYHFAETNPALKFDRKLATGTRLNIASGTAVRFEPGQSRTVELVQYAGKREVYGFNGLVMGPLKKPAAKPPAKAAAKVVAKVVAKVDFKKIAKPKAGAKK